jgi:transcriptional regulator with XRE-family HTH domain
MTQIGMISKSRRGVGARIKQARYEAGYTVEKLARELGVGLRTVNRWQTGESLPRYEQLAELAVVLRKPVSYFLEGESA